MAKLTKFNSTRYHL